MIARALTWRRGHSVFRDGWRIVILANTVTGTKLRLGPQLAP
jgi:hypothetical protein